MGITGYMDHFPQW